MSVSAIVPVWNGRQLLTKLLDSLERQTLQPSEVLVVDNGSSDGAPEMAERRGARVIRLGRNTGFAHAVNCGVESAHFESLAILNSDVELDSGWLHILSDTRAPFAAGKILAAAHPEQMDGAFDLLSRGGCAWRAGHGKPDRAGLFPETGVASVSFTATLFTKQLFREVGPLDERFESYLEDVDFGLRCAAHGIQGTFAPRAVCRHWGSASLGRWHAGTVRRISRNQVFLVAKHYPAPLVLRWWWPIFVAQGLWGAVALRHGAGFSWLLGKFDAFRALPVSADREFNPRLAIMEQERTIRRLQNELGADWYWRLYFALMGEAV